VARIDQTARNHHRRARKNAVLIVELFALAWFGYFLEDHKEKIPALVKWQSHAFAFLSGLDLRPARADRVALVLIEDDLYYRPPQPYEKGPPLDRSLLADLVAEAAQANPAVIALDINLAADNADEASRGAMNANLMASIANVYRQYRIPVVLTVGLEKAAQPNEWVRCPNFYADQGGSPEGTLEGFDNGPQDFLRLPLEKTSADNNYREKSFALQTVNAYEDTLHVKPEQRTETRLSDVVRSGEFVFGTFLPQNDFLAVSAHDLLNCKTLKCKPDHLPPLQHRVVLIGGKVRIPGTDKYVDEHEGPLEPMIGAFFQANYVEALLDQRLKLPTPGWIAFVVDCILGFALVACFHSVRPAMHWAVLAIFLLPLALAYFLFVNLRYSIDFVLPLGLLFLHLALEHYSHRWHMTILLRRD
jgi:hypothetical protein